MKLKIYLLCALVLFTFLVKAQTNLGIATGNWSSTQSLYLNPANIADSREKIIIDIVSINAGINNNLGTLGSVSDFSNAVKDGNTDNIFKYTGRNTFSLMAPAVNVHGPGVMVKINDKNSIALTTSIRGINQFNNFDKSLYRTIIDTSYVTNGDVDLTSKNFNYTAQLWTEIGLTYGAVLLNDGQNELRAGVTLRYLGGIGYVSLKGNNLDAHYKSGVDSFYAEKTDIEFASNILSTSSALQNGFTNNNLFSEFFGKKDGRGVGGDIGLVYDYFPDADHNYKHTGRNGYKVRLSASVTDIGSIKYNSNVNSNANVTGNGYLTGQGLINNVRSFDDFRNYAKKQGFTADTSSAATKVHLPTALILGADYSIQKNFYVNATFLGNLANRQNVGNSYYGQVTVTPRYDTRLLTIGLPISYSMLTQGMKMGLGVRFSGFFVGSDDMLRLFSSNQYGFNLYFGGYVPLYSHKQGASVSWHKHKSDSTDIIPEPDMEHGGATDTTDNCPDLFERINENSAAVVQQDDSTDTDGDGIPDSRDACPKVAGPASNHGCPLPQDPPKKTVNFSTTTIQTFNSKSAVNKESEKTLDEIVTVLKEYPNYDVIVNGYTDNFRTAAKNNSLSKMRANSVKDYFISKGIAAERIEAHGLGASEPVADNTSLEGSKMNNRVVINLKKPLPKKQ